MVHPEYEVPHPFKVTIETKRQEIEELKAKKEKIHEKHYTTAEILEIKLEKEKIKKKNIKEWFEVFAEREMTEEEYIQYREKLDDPKTAKGYNIKNFVEELINEQIKEEKKQNENKEER